MNMDRRREASGLKLSAKCIRISREGNKEDTSKACRCRKILHVFLNRPVRFHVSWIYEQVLGKGFTEVKQDVGCGRSVRKSRVER